MNLQRQRPAIGINQRVTLTAFDLFPGVEASRTPAFRGLHRLAVDYGRRGARLAADALAIQHHQMMVASPWGSRKQKPAPAKRSACIMVRSIPVLPVPVIPITYR